MVTPMNAGTALSVALELLAREQQLSRDVTREAFAEVMAGTATAEEIRALLLGLRRVGATAEVIAAIVETMRQVMTPVDVTDRRHLTDTCGTGGGQVRTVNISTAAAFVAAAAGVPVAKHGNRSHTSRSGSADVLEALGISTAVSAATAPQVLAQAGIVFLFAPLYHPAMRHVAPVRRELGLPTVMNLVGPLANPARVDRQVIGVADPETGPLLAGALRALATEHALVVHGEIGVDELASVGRSRIWEVRQGQIVERMIDPADWGLATPDMSGTAGGDPAENADLIAALFNAPDAAAPALRATVLLNAAAAIEVSGTVADFGEAVAVATAALDQGGAAACLARLRRAAPLRTSE